MEKEDKTGCIFIIIAFVVLLLFTILLAIATGMFAKKPKEVIQTYEVAYVNGLKDTVSYKVHEGTKACIDSHRGSYYLSFYYENVNLFGFKYKESDGCIAGVVSYKRVK